MAETLMLSDNAAKRIAYLLTTEPEGSVLRVAVDGGGCSGFQYRFAFDTALNEDDQLIEKDGAKVAVDDISLEYIGGSIVEYEESLAGAAFSIKNPQATASCGCGNSFAV